MEDEEKRNIPPSRQAKTVAIRSNNVSFGSFTYAAVSDQTRFSTVSIG